MKLKTELYISERVSVKKGNLEWDIPNKILKEAQKRDCLHPICFYKEGCYRLVFKEKGRIRIIIVTSFKEFEEVSQTKS